jgi:hypothetical protein
MEEEEEFVEIKEAPALPIAYSIPDVPLSCERITGIKLGYLRNKLEYGKTLAEIRELEKKAKEQKMLSRKWRHAAKVQIRSRYNEPNFMEDLYKCDIDAEGTDFTILLNPFRRGTESQLNDEHCTRINPIKLFIDENQRNPPIILGSVISFRCISRFLHHLHISTVVHFFVPMNTEYIKPATYTRNDMSRILFGQVRCSYPPYLQFVANAAEYIQREWIMQSLVEICNIKKRSDAMLTFEFASRQIKEQAERLCIEFPYCAEHVRKFVELGCSVGNFKLVSSSSQSIGNLYFNFETRKRPRQRNGGKGKASAEE